MTTGVCVAIAYVVSFVAAVVPFGARMAQPEFWFTFVVYGLPLIVLAWPLYVARLRRIVSPVGRAFAGAAFFPIPSLLLQLMHWALNGELVANPIRFFNGLYLPFLLWYLLFGFVLGAMFAFSGSARRHQSSAL